MALLSGALDELWVWHQPWSVAGDARPPTPMPRSGAVRLETCLRRLEFGLAPALAPGAPGELLRGRRAYRLLLEVASGLRSAVPGETNVFGQFRAAWELAAPALPATMGARLGAVVDALVADTRRVRREHLQGLAGTSYGSLTRALLMPARAERLLLVGAGQLARSLLPLFAAQEVAVWNRRPVQGLSDRIRCFAPEAAQAAAAWASCLIFTTPADDSHDHRWREHLADGNLRRIVHLGQRRGTGARPSAGLTWFDLDDVFALAAQRDGRRSQTLEIARQACAALTDARWTRPAGRTPAPARPLLAPAPG